MLATDGMADDRFGYSVDVYGPNMVIGANRADDGGNNSGKAYLLGTGTFTSIEEPSFLRNITMYPNPVRNELKISGEMERATALQINLLTITGQKLLSTELGEVFGEFSQTLDVSQLVNGVYLVQLVSENGVMVRRFWVNQ